MFSLISKFVKRIWSKWNIRLVILFSLFLQIFLIVSAPSRKRTRRFFVSYVWLAYLLADWAAGYCIGLISNNQEHKKSTHCQNEPTNHYPLNDHLMAFWGPFLLLHLGGPDTISAFALEDNELWLRHFVSLIFQSVTAAYVFFLTLPRNTLLLPTILMFVAGLIKYAERIHALYVAAINNFRKSLLPDPDAGPNYAKLMEEHSSRQEVGLPAKIIMIPELRERSNEAAKSHSELNDKADNKHHPQVEQKPGHPQVNSKQKADHLRVEKADNEHHVKLVQKAFFFFHKFQGLIVDMIYSFKDRLDSREYFNSITAEEALTLIEIELNFMYEVFYTKTSVVRRYWFRFWGKFVSLISITATLVLFIKAERHGGFDPSDVRVTYALLSGALVLDAMALILRFFTDYTATLSDESLIDSYEDPFYQRFQIRLFKHLNKRFLECSLGLRKPTWSKIKDDGPYKDCEKLSTKYLFRRWSGSIAGYNLLRYCLDESVPRLPNNLHGSFEIVIFVQDFFYRRDKRSRFKDLLDQWRYKSINPFLKELWEYIFEQLKKKSGEAQDIEDIQSICSDIGEQVVQKALESSKPNVVDPNKVAAQLESLKPFVDTNEVAFDQSLLLWHIATALCYYEDAEVEGHKREISMLLSDYMLYLLVMQPNMLSAIAGIGQKRFQDTCEEAKKFFKKRISAQGDRTAMLEKAYKILMEVPTEQKPSDVKGDRSKSLLFYACRLAHELKNLEDKEKKWEIISGVWVELLSYAACHCRPTGYVKLLSKGGELISFVWLLMVQLGLSTQFQIKEGDARAKLIVGK